jgi:hypothetical protein
MWSKIAITSFFLAIGVFLFNMFDVYLGFGSSVVFSQSPKSLVDFLGPANFEWIQSIPSYWVRSIAGYVAQVPLTAILIYIGVFSLLVYFIIPDRKNKSSVPLRTRKSQPDG